MRHQRQSNIVPQWVIAAPKPEQKVEGKLCPVIRDQLAKGAFAPV